MQMLPCRKEPFAQEAQLVAEDPKQVKQLLSQF